MLDSVGGDALSHRVMEIDPETASDWLARSDRLCSLPEARVAELARDMAAGAWKLNGEAILFDLAGRLLDGRKRLAAGIRAGASFPTLVIEGLPPDAALTLDGRRRRQLGDVLSIAGHDHSKATGTALKLLCQAGRGTWKPRKVTCQEVMALREAHPGVADAVAASVGAGRPLTPGFQGAARYLLSRIDPEGAAAFLAGVDDADGLRMGDPRRALAHRVASARDGSMRALSHEEMFAFLAKTWNAWRAGAALKQLRWTRTGDKAEPFPALAGWSDAMAVLPGESSAVPEAVAGVGDAEPLEVEFRWIDPEEAAQLLLRNTRNRAISRSIVEKYARNMSSGDWKLNGETIKFASGPEGRLLDGQHRLSACVRSGATIPVLIVHNVREDTFDTLDIGERRDFAHVLADRDVRNPAAIAGAVNIVWRIEAGHMASAVQPTAPELEACLNRNPGIAVATAQITRCKGMLSPALAVACAYLFGRSRPDMAARFFEKLEGIGNTSHRDPVLLLARKLREGRAVRGVGNSSPVDRMAWCVKAWNGFVEGRETGVLKWVRTGENAEVFPAIR